MQRISIGDLVSYSNDLTGSWVGIVVAFKRRVGRRKVDGLPQPGKYFLVSFPGSQRLAAMRIEHLRLVEKAK